MKKLFAMLFLVFISISLFSQMNVDDFYESRKELLICSKVEKFDSLSISVLKNRIKNWAGTHFVNSEETLISESDDQLVFRYITDSYYVKAMGKNYFKWYIRMVIQIKENRIKISLYDDGNVFRPGGYAGNYKIPSVPANSEHFYDAFDNNGISRKKCEDGLIDVKTSCTIFRESLISSIRYDSSLNSKSTDW